MSIRLLDALLVIGISPYLLVRLIGLLVPRRKMQTRERRMMVLDTAYSLHTIRERQIERSITCRDLNGYFDRVFTVHPLVGADASEPEAHRSGPIRRTELSAGHTVIENPIHHFPALRHLTSTNFLLAQLRLIQQLNRLIHSERIGLVRVGDPHYQGLVGWLLAKRNGIPLVIRIGGNTDAIYERSGRLAYPRLLPTRRIEKAVERFCLRNADLVVGANQDNLEFAIRNGACRERTAVFRYGNLVAPDHFTPPDERPPIDYPPAGETSGPLLAFVGRLEQVKHVDDLPGVLALVLKCVPDAKLLVVGDGSRRTRMYDRAVELGIEHSLIFAGNRDQNWIAKLMPRVSVIVSPHMGRALVETSLGAVPVVAYNHDWQAELIDDGENGYLVPLGDTDAMAARTIELLTNPARAREMGHALRQKALEMMDPEKLTAHERETYERLLARKNASPRLPRAGVATP